MTHSGIYSKYYDAQISDLWYEVWRYKIMAHMLEPNTETPLEIKRVLI